MDVTGSATCATIESSVTMPTYQMKRSRRRIFPTSAKITLDAISRTTGARMYATGRYPTPTFLMKIEFEPTLPTQFAITVTDRSEYRRNTIPRSSRRTGNRPRSQVTRAPALPAGRRASPMGS